MPEKFGGFQN